MAIRNPLEWGVDQLRLAVNAVDSAGRAIREEQQATPLTISRIGLADLRAALAQGFDDFTAYRTDVVFLCVIYPILGLVLGRLAFGYDMVPLLFPLASGFALIGPFAAVGLYEMSRRRERGLGLETALRRVELERVGVGGHGRDRLEPVGRGDLAALALGFGLSRE